MDRRLRQQIEVVVAAVRGDHDRATVLAREHLLEFSDDEVVQAVLSECAVPGGGKRRRGTAHSIERQV